MKKLSLILSALFIVVMLPVSAQAATAEQISEAAKIGQYYVEGNILDYWIISSSPFTVKYDSAVGHYVTGNEYRWDSNTKSFIKDTIRNIKIENVKYSSHDLKDTNDTVFFSAPLPPIPAALREIVPYLLGVAMKAIPVAVMILGAMMGVSLISRVLYRFL